MTAPKKRVRPRIRGDVAWCPECQQWLSLGSFRKGTDNPLQGYCKECIAPRSHKLSRQEFEAMKSRQNDLCAVCRREWGERGPYIDHDHRCCPGEKSCGKCVRGLLCRFCNTAAGFLQDDPAVVDALSQYLRSYECVTYSV